MVMKIQIRRGTTPIPSGEIVEVGEPIWDIPNNRIGVGKGDSFPVMYPGIDPNTGDLVLNPGTALTAKNSTVSVQFSNNIFYVMNNDTPIFAINSLGQITMTGNTVQSGITLNCMGAGDVEDYINFKRDNIMRWRIELENSTNTSVANAFVIDRFNSLGQFVDAPFAIYNDTGVTSFSQPPVAPTAATLDNSNKLATTHWVRSQGYVTAADLTTIFNPGGSGISGGATPGSIGNSAASVPYNSSGLYIDPDAGAPSDERIKENIKPCHLGLDFINALNPVSYRFKGKTKTRLGLTTQQVQATARKFETEFGGISLSDENDPNSTQRLHYDDFVAPLIRSIQELSLALREKEEALNKMSQEFQELKTLVLKMQAS